MVSFSDVKLERDYLFCRALAALVRDVGVGGLDLGSTVELTHLRVQQTFEGSLSLDEGDGEVSTIFGGAGPRRLPEEEPLSQIISELNSADLDALVRGTLKGDETCEIAGVGPISVQSVRTHGPSRATRPPCSGRRDRPRRCR